MAQENIWQESHPHPKQRQDTWFVRMLKGVWRAIDGTRRLIFNLIFLFLVIFLLVAMFTGDKLVITEKTALVVAPVGVVVEQFSSDPVERALNSLMDQQIPETRLRDLIAAIDRGAEDDNISHMVIRPDYLFGIGLSKLQELKKAVERFKATGKPVYAYSVGMMQQQYYLAALADEIWMHPEGLALLEGFGAYRNYYAEGLEKLAVDVHLFRVGEFKSAAEPYIRNDMSEESKAANLYLLNGLWDDYLTDVASLRGMDTAGLSQIVDEYPALLEQAGGSPAQMALESGLVDQIADEEAFREAMIAFGEIDDEEVSFKQVDASVYLRISPELPSPLADQIAVVVAQGPIMYGEQPPGTVGGDSASRLLRDARNDDAIKAVVLRVDSPGGAVLPSEQIRREVELLRDAGKPVVVSMSSVAASGGYWISMDADRILANPTTITGSIGIFGLFTNFPRTLEKVGIYTDGVGTTEMAGALRPDRPLQPQISNVIQQIIEDGYEKFITKVAEARSMEVDSVDQVARGRVWTGRQALERGLVDELGGIEEALTAAAELAELEDFETNYLEKKPTPFEQFIIDMSATLPSINVGEDSVLLRLIGDMERQAGSDIELLMAQRTQRLGTYAYCFCTIE